MLIEIDGGGFSNKGAELMLKETVRRVRCHMPEASVAVATHCGPYRDRAELGLYQIPRSRYGPLRIEWGHAIRLLPADVRRSLGLVLSHEIDAVLDPSGYRYRRHKYVKALAKRARRSRRQGKKFVLLPQAFGPFSDRSRQPLTTVVQSVDLIYARDEISYNCIVDLVGESTNLRIAPDFTLALPGFLRPRHEALRGGLGLIPNQRMLDQTEAVVRAAYVPLLRECVRRALEAGMQPFVLIHDINDEVLAHDIVDGFCEDIDVVKEWDACAIKGIIGIAGAVISSRFHGLVSALSQGVPALGTGWSHKYEMLFRDYGFDAGLIGVPAESHVLERKLGMLMDESSRASLASQLHTAAEQQRMAIEEMWAEVFAVLKQA